MERAWHPAFTLQLARIAQIDEHHIILAMQRDCVIDAEGLDFRVRFRQELFVTFLHVHHRGPHVASR
jgi:hypothetical protein